MIDVLVYVSDKVWIWAGLVLRTLGKQPAAANLVLFLWHGMRQDSDILDFLYKHTFCLEAVSPDCAIASILVGRILVVTWLHIRLGWTAQRGIFFVSHV